MASVAKYPAGAVKNILAHNDRTIPHPSNEDIDPSRSHLNYSLVDHGMPAYEYYWARRQEVHCHHRADMKPLCGWVMTQPQDLDTSQEYEFFQESYNFVAARYGERNMIQATVHKDESGQNHLHVTFIPVIYDTKKKYEKIAVNEVITRADLKTFHQDWQHYLNAHGIECSVYTGVTKANGGSKTVAQLKKERELQQIGPLPVQLQQEELQHDRWASPSIDPMQIEPKERGRW